ncbi:MAG: hypothetical protein JWR50_2412 [Mucilaginibacter sp.]|nr:hypothetical protein [Mucilaginibacter sp.]
MTDDKILINLINKSILWRGQLLHQISILELGVNIYLANYFCGSNDDKMIDMQNFILGDDRMSLSAKQQVFFGIASTRDAEWYNSYKTIRPSQPKKKDYTMNTDMVWVIEQRNIFAHRMLDLDSFRSFNKREEGVVRFIRMKNELTPIDYPESDFELLMKTVFHIAEHIQKRTSAYSPLNLASDVSSESSMEE